MLRLLVFGQIPTRNQVIEHTADHVGNVGHIFRPRSRADEIVDRGSDLNEKRIGHLRIAAKTKATVASVQSEQFALGVWIRRNVVSRLSEATSDSLVFLFCRTQPIVIVISLPYQLLLRRTSAGP